MRWLGVELPDGTKKRVLSKGDPKACVQEAIEICRENLQRILNACTRYGIGIQKVLLKFTPEIYILVVYMILVDIPLGFTCECVSKHREEIEGVAELFKVCYHILISWRLYSLWY